MCSLQMFGLLSIIPYLLLLLMPLYGSFYGKEPVLGLAFFLLGQSILTSFTSRFLVLAEPLVQLAIVIVLISLRITLIPYPLIWCLDKVLFISEPIWQVLEALGVVHLSMELSQEAAQHIDDKPGLAKGVILTVSGVSYTLLLYLLWCIIITDQAFYIWAAVAVLLFSVILHVLVIKNDSGILSDAAVIGTCSMALLYDLVQCSTATQSEITIPQVWSRYPANHSYSQMMVQIVLSSGRASSDHAWQQVSMMWSPWFLVTSLARICCILYSIGLARLFLNKLAEWSEQDDSPLEESCDIDLEEEEIPVTLTIARSPLLIKLVVIFVYTQYLVCHVTSHHLDDSLLSWLQSWFPSGRWIQIILLNGYFIYRLEANDEAYG